MVHKVALFAITGIALSAVCLGAGAAIEGRQIGHAFAGLDLGWGGDRPSCETVAGATATSRDLDWDGSDHFGMAVSGHARYAPGNGAQLHVTGDPQVLAHLRLHSGNIEMDCRGWHDRTRDLTMTVPGREFRKFAILGGGDLALNHLMQNGLTIEIAGAGNVTADAKVDTLRMNIEGSGHADFSALNARQARIEISGSGTIMAKGRADDLNIAISGSGKIDFGEVKTRNAEVSIGGHGDVAIAASESAKIDIGGSGDVYLHGDPKQLETQIGGSGRIHKVASGG